MFETINYAVNEVYCEIHTAFDDYRFLNAKIDRTCHGTANVKVSTDGYVFRRIGRKRGLFGNAWPTYVSARRETPRTASHPHLCTVFVAPSSNLRLSRARSPVPSPEHFAWMGTLFGRKDTHKPWINYFFEWNVVDELAADVHRVCAKWRWPRVSQTSELWRD